MRKKIEMKDLGKTHKKGHLRRVHTFLNDKIRPLEKKELKSEKVFKEIFGEEATVELWKLKAIYEYQN